MHPLQSPGVSCCCLKQKIGETGLDGGPVRVYAVPVRADFQESSRASWQHLNDRDPGTTTALMELEWGRIVGPNGSST
jgi:hypothetical protein